MRRLSEGEVESEFGFDCAEPPYDLAVVWDSSSESFFGLFGFEEAGIDDSFVRGCGWGFDQRG